MIADFVHLDPAVVKLLLNTKGFRNITLISDTGFMGGLPDGEYKGRIVKDGVARTQAGVICGSYFTMLRGAQNLRKLGVPLEEISVMASRNPAKLLGVQDTVGSIALGYRADLILCDEELNIHTVLIDGNPIK
jgi:N-acetylglucosamine-6-phosphate deacetylase